MKTVRIWIIDDDPAISAGLKELLELQDFDVSICVDDQILNPLFEKKMKISKPDLIILDLRLGEIDGRTVAKKLKQSPRTKKIPIILVSAFTKELKKTPTDLVDAQISKPFDFIHLVQTINALTN